MSHDKKYYFSIGVLFKNESHIMREWLEHHFFHGVDHIYMINDNSDDIFMYILQPYIEKGLITLYNVQEPYYLGRQRKLYNEYFLPIVKDSYWFGIFDMDEFLYSIINVDVRCVLKNCEMLGQIQMSHYLFGSNYLEIHPKYIIPNFTRRSDPTKNNDTMLKYIINTNYDFTSLNIHHADFLNDENRTNGKFLRLDYQSYGGKPYFSLNHYSCQSKEFWLKVKSKRGDADHYLKRDIDQFNNLDCNDVEDLALFNQNKID